MQLISILVLLPLALQYVNAQQNTTLAAQELASLSACGLTCLTTNIPIVHCTLLDISCQCKSERLLELTSACLYANCTLREALEVSKTTAAICEKPSESQNRMLRIMTYICATITNGAVLTRLLVRWLLRQQFKLDDAFIVLATISAAFFTYFGVLFEANGFGDHIWDVDFDVVPDLLYWFYICEALYILTIGLVKISIICFYLSVFPKKSFRIATFTVLGLVIASMITFILTGIFQCSPISFAWQRDLKGTCINYNAVSWANAGLNIVQDILIVLLPIKELWSLQMSPRKKIGLYAMFGVGSFVCLTAIIRLYTLRHFGLTADPTWDNVPTIFWSTLESTAAVFCACMPTMRAGLKRLFPKVFGSTGAFKSSPGGSPDGSTGVKNDWSSKVSRAAKNVANRGWLSNGGHSNAGAEAISLGTKQGDKFVRLPDSRATDIEWAVPSARMHDPLPYGMKELPALPRSVG